MNVDKNYVATIKNSKEKKTYKKSIFLEANKI